MEGSRWSWRPVGMGRVGMSSAALDRLVSKRSTHPVPSIVLPTPTAVATVAAEAAVVDGTGIQLRATWHIQEGVHRWALTQGGRKGLADHGSIYPKQLRNKCTCTLTPLLACIAPFNAASPTAMPDASAVPSCQWRCLSVWTSTFVRMV